MIIHSPAKINLGLRIIQRRSDGFHNLQSLMYPLGLCDILEIREAKNARKSLTFSQSGIFVDGGSGSNLCEKAHKVFSAQRVLPPMEIHLHKQIPIGAGLGGGSSNATKILLALNQLIPDPLALELLHEMAAELGSDCPFFLHDRAMMMEGRGELLAPSSVSLKNLYLVLLFPEIHISTPEAYAGIRPQLPELHLNEVLAAPIREWKDTVINDFEAGIFEKYPLLSDLKAELYKEGAIYASMSGSGSSLYGIFKQKPELPESVSRFKIWEGPALV